MNFFLRHVWPVALLVILSFFPLHSQTKANPVKKLQKEILELISQKPFDNAAWGVAIQSLRNDEVLDDINSKKNFIPASNMKIFTTVFALAKLGPDFHYTTRVFLQGRFENDTTFNGNIIIRGMGDPTISGRFNGEKVTKTLEDWADSLKKIKILRGKIIGDDNFFGDDILGVNWEWSEESYWYSAQVSGLCFNDNCVDWFVSPTKIGQPAKIQIRPNTRYLNVINHVVTVASASEATEIQFVRARCTNTAYAEGKIFVDTGTLAGNVTVENPTLYAATVFKETLQSRGIRIDSGAADIDSLRSFSYKPSDSNIVSIASYHSPKMDTLLKVINKKSQNLYAEQIWRTVAAVLDSQGTGKHARELELKFLKEIGVPVESMAITDGSGYARTNLVSPADILTALKFIRKHKYWSTFFESLPIAGVDGTLRHRMVDTPAENNVRAKTGYIDNVRTISGFVKTQDNEELAFSILCNNFTADKLEIEKIEDLILVKLASFSRK
jgi:D-alanyl-D-alanine carboxypeptidase/D-alanyl-D-alanine-endopeptidase (penicillin-binding protein 4)